MISSSINYVLSNFSESNQSNIKLAGKALLAASVIAGLALATFNMMSLGNAAYAEAIANSSTASAHELLQSWGKAGTLKGAAYGLGIATAIAPLHASSVQMFEQTRDNEQNTFDFIVGQIFLITVIVLTVSVINRHDYVEYGTRMRLIELKR